MPLSAPVAVDVALSRFYRSVPGEQLDVAQAVAAALDIASGGGDEDGAA